MKPMDTYLAAHPTDSKQLRKLDVRTITFEDWIIYIIRENQGKLPWNKNKQG